MEKSNQVRGKRKFKPENGVHFLDGYHRRW
jgi:hypothetical protein